MAGTLFLVATPIGNLEDITYRAVRILGEVSLVACEDTRHTRKLLDHYGIRKPLLSYHEHNESGRVEELVAKLEDGVDIALVSDAGTPLISDPGYELVKRAADEGIAVVPVPGPSAALTALAAAGLPSDSFHFIGFLPLKGARRRRVLDTISALDSTVILYEAPHRILQTLDDLRVILGERPLVAAREMTKMHEEFLRGSASAVHEILAGRESVTGEFTIVIGKANAGSRADPRPLEVLGEVQRLIDSGSPRMDAIKAAAKKHGLPKRTVYDLLEREPE
jgi:16S rRNA (cytidine1402-2'-O)-methyltransferase